jgi:hypothetical protein
MEDQVTERSAARARAHPDPQPTRSTSPGFGAVARLPWIFRDASRRGQVHPLMELVRRYRTEAAGGADDGGRAT